MWLRHYLVVNTYYVIESLYESVDISAKHFSLATGGKFKPWHGVASHTLSFVPHN